MTIDPQEIINQCRKAGADAADLVMLESAGLTVSLRLGEPENVERSESTDLGLRVFVGRQSAMVSTSDVSPKGIAATVGRVVAMARAMPEDKWARLAEPGQLAREVPDLDLYDPSEPTATDLLALCGEAEGAALAVEGTTNSEGAQASWGQSRITLATSNGFSHSYRSSDSSLSVSVLAGEGTAMEREDEYTVAAHRVDLRAAVAVGREAGEKAVKRLNPRRVKTGQYPVVLEPRVAAGLLRTFAGGINGASVARGTTFLKDSLNKQLFPADIKVIDDPLRQRGLRSHPFDGEGLAGQPLTIVENGALRHFILDLVTAARLGMVSNGRASRGVSAPPSPSASNLYLQPGTVAPEDLMSDIKDGFYVTETMGMGVNLITGDYSQGAAGYWIENGKIAYPVSELTIAGQLQDMLAGLQVANDLEFRSGIDAPTVRLPAMMVAGE